VRVTWTNHLQNNPHLFAVDPTLHWADPNDAGMPAAPFAPYPPGFPSAQAPVPIVTHLHGGEVSSVSDGFPLAFYTADGKQGPSYGSILTGESSAATYLYPNAQPPAALWYHDHALGITRLNVMAGLSGFYILRDPKDTVAASLPSSAFEVPILIQDRTFTADGALAFANNGVNPAVHPYWRPEFFGDVITVNGRVWPDLDVEPTWYRLRVLNGSNARFYDLQFVDDATNPVAFTQIGTDGGYLPEPVTLRDLLIAPGERADLIVNFGVAPGRRIRLLNHANAPFPGGDPPNPETTGQIMQFTVASGKSPPPPQLPAVLAKIPSLSPDQPARVLTLFDVKGDGGPLVTTLNGQSWAAPPSETPRLGSTEDWRIANLSEDAHPIHLHLVKFQLMSRQPFDAKKYTSDWTALNGSPAFPVRTSVKALDPAGYATGAARGPARNERGWKDTIVAMRGEVTTLRVRVAPSDAPQAGPGAASPGVNRYGFDPTEGPGYVWHCHMLDHEDNEMMRPMTIKPYRGR
jgi:FtsP/CotA-like multicopper oxidase with cupredoxin domain